MLCWPSWVFEARLCAAISRKSNYKQYSPGMYFRPMMPSSTALLQPGAIFGLLQPTATSGLRRLGCLFSAAPSQVAPVAHIELLLRSVMPQSALVSSQSTASPHVNVASRIACAADT